MSDFAYFQEQDSEQFSFFRIPKILFSDERFRNLSSEAKILYGLMLDRVGLSRKNGWVDAEGNVYIHFTIEEMMSVLKWSRYRIFQLLDELDEKEAEHNFLNMDPYFISDKKKKEGICLSVKGLTNGAVAVLYPEVIKKLVELMDGDFYVVFSSVHEALIHSSKLCSLEELENLLRTSNSRMTFQKEFLTDKVYYYCREKDKFIMLQGSLKMLVTTIRMDEEN